jgi:hypothetical protein
MTGDESVRARHTVRDHTHYVGVLYGAWGAVNIAASDRNAQAVRDAAKQFQAAAMELAALIDQEAGRAPAPWRVRSSPVWGGQASPEVE